MKKIIFLFFVLIFAVVAAIGWYGYQDYESFKDQSVNIPAEGMTYTLVPGSSIKSLAADLEQKGVLERAVYLELLARETGLAEKIKAGEYQLQTGLTSKELLNVFVAGKTLQYRFSIIEGKRYQDALKTIAGLEHVERTLGEDDFVAVFQQLTGEAHPEGWLFPDTYHYPKNITDIQLIKNAYQMTQSTLAELWAERDENLPFDTPYEALVLASIVEKETAVADERPLIAGVFVNRLRKGMRLQTDPTVIYGMGDSYQGNIRKKDLKTDTPWNTYTRAGLPPTPIATAGREAIAAVLHPDATDKLFFVASGGGRHEFTETYEEHRKAVIKYQLGGNAKRYKGDQ